MTTSREQVQRTSIEEDPAVVRLFEEPASTARPRVAVVLAAGLSSRMAVPAGGGSKALLHLGGLTLVVRAIRRLLALGLERVIVIVGHDAPTVADIVNGTSPERVAVVFAERWADGNGSSLAAAAPHLEEEELFLVVTADHVFSDDALEALLGSQGPAGLVDHAPSAEAWAEGTRVRLHGSRALGFSKEFDDPSIDCGAFVLPRDVFAAQERAVLDGDFSLAGAISTLADTCHIEAVPVAPSAWWLDIDTPEDLESAKHALRRSLVKVEDGPVSRYVNRPISTRLSMFISSLRPKPDLVSYLALGVALVAAWLLAIGDGIVGGLLVAAGSILDGMDGEAARLQIRGSASGALLDGVLDRAADTAILVGLAIWAARDGASPEVTIALCAAAVSTSILSMASKDRIKSLGMTPAPEAALGWLFGSRDARLLIVSVAGLAGLPLVAIATVTATSGLTLIVRLVLVRRLAHR